MLHRWQIFKDLEESGRLTGILLLIATAISMLLANSVVSVSYIGFWEIKVGAGPLYKTVHHWVNDGLMAAFFLLVGLEIKRELLDGELASPRKAALPLVAALGGVVLPAVIYISFNAGLPSMTGWAIPMATDIAFSLGILSMLGRRVPASLKIFLTALAVIDDLFAIVIIAVFYTHQLAATYLIYAGIVLVGLF
ncbi:MAG: Na+/H+ antiporter NhaA, partial [Bacteroidetes bacterium]|nr:Na+/H+ antiporter NhaA [Bacteroidota bacterium]